MPVTKSAAKRARQSLKRHQRNLNLKRVMRRDIKAVLTAIAESDAASVTKRMSSAQSSLDRAVKANLIHKNKAARQKSKLVKLAKTKTVKSATKTTKKLPVKKSST